MRVLDSWRLALGTLTIVPVRPPRVVNRDVGGLAMVLAPLAAVPLGAAVSLVLWAGPRFDVSPWLSAAVALAVLVLGNRAFHLDGLADTVDALAASRDRQRALEVMKLGNVGPAGVAAIVLVLLIQFVAFVELDAWPDGWLLVGLVIVASRAALPLACVRGIRAARPTGLGVTVAGTVPLVVATLVWVAVGIGLVAAYTNAGESWHHAAGALAAGLVATLTTVSWCVRRFGGVTGDVLGATVEITLAAMLVLAG